MARFISDRVRFRESGYCHWGPFGWQSADTVSLTSTGFYGSLMTDVDDRGINMEREHGLESW